MPYPDESADPRAHHPLITAIEPWRGWVRPGDVTNWLGVRSSAAMWLDGTGPTLLHQWRRLLPAYRRRYEYTSRPRFDEEYIEWLALAESVAAARKHFAMIELGAGWGRWLLNAAALIRLRRDLTLQLIGVEAEPKHYRWLRRHFRRNGLRLRDHALIRAAITAGASPASFYMGRAADWWGQCLLIPGLGLRAVPARVRRGVRIKRVAAVTLTDLLARYRYIDYIDSDIQGAELDVFAAAADHVDRRVRSVFIETHYARTEAGLRDMFRGLGWTSLADYPRGEISQTPYGPIMFPDGAQWWSNPRFPAVAAIPAPT
jgi:FkbM family methyltransferase